MKICFGVLILSLGGKKLNCVFCLFSIKIRDEFNIKIINIKDEARFKKVISYLSISTKIYSKNFIHDVILLCHKL